MRRVIHFEHCAVRLVNLIGNRRRGRYDFEIKLPFQPFLNDLHMQKPQKTATEAETQRDGIIRFKGQRSVVELQLHQRVFEIAETAAV